MGTLLLALSLTCTAFADKKKKKSSDAESAPAAESSDSSSGGDDIDSMMSNSVKGKDKRDKSGEAAEPKKEEPPPDDGWERPPVEEEKPKGPPPKAAEKPAGDGKHISVGLLAGWAFKTDRKSGMAASDPYQLGFGIRGGYTWDFNLYTGVFFMYYIGSSTSGSFSQMAGSASSSANYIQFGAEVGYDFWAGPVIIRPSLELGPAMLLFSGSGLGVPNGSYTRLLLGPGVTLAYPIDQWFIGGDARFNVVTSTNGASAFLLALHGGMRFE